MGRRWFGRPRADVYSNLGNIEKFSYSSLRIATDNFSKNRLIGQGGFARVFKGLLADGTLIAVKNYKNAQSKLGLEDFSCSLKLMSRIRHRNIVKLIGYCMEDDCFLLVTEFAEFGSLGDLIKNSVSRDFRRWHRRSAICMGIARGISYLHYDANPCAIHLDIKPANILIDSNFTPKITDFDLAKVFCEPYESVLESTHKTDTIAGTYGYMAPEYMIEGEYSRKTDVFSFGVLMLQLISGRNAYGLFHGDAYENRRAGGIISWVSLLMRNDRLIEIIDPVLTDYSVDVVQSFIVVALLCVQREPDLRPSMQEAMHMLYGVFNSNSQSLTRLDVSMLDDLSICHSYLGTSGDIEDEDEDEDENESLTLLDDDTVKENDSADALVDSNTGMNTQGEGEVVETSTDDEHRQQQQTKKKMMKPGIILSGSGDLVERLSKTTVFKRRPENAFPEAVYPPLLTSVVRRPGSRNHVQRQSFTMEFKKNVCPEAVYPPFHTRRFKRFGSRNLHASGF